MRSRFAVLTALAVAFALFAAGCDDSGDSASGGGGDCLTPNEVQREVDQIAGGFETSEEEVQAKQDEIAEVRARACK